jgi:hypothetical protein
MVRAYDKLVKQRVFRKGELVLVLRRPIVVTHKTKGKFEPKWEGPYAIEQVYDGGAYQLVDPQGARPMPPINGRFFKNIFAKICLFCCFFFFHGEFFRRLESMVHSPLHCVDICFHHFQTKQNGFPSPHHAGD